MKDERWNFAAALIDAVGWGLGMGLVSHATLLPLFVGGLTDSAYAIGAISGLMYLGWFLPGVLVARRIERLATVRGWVLSVALLERIGLLALVPLTLSLWPEQRRALLSAFFACWFVTSFGVGCNTPAYYKLIAKTISPTRRGRLYGIGGALAGLLGMVGGETAGRLLATNPYPIGFVWCFAAAFVVQTLSVLPLGWMREPRGDAQPGDSTARREPVSLRAVARDPALQGLVVSHTLFCGTLMAAAFYTDYAVRRFGVSETTVGHFTTAMRGAEVVAYLLLGWLSDRHGNRRALQLATLAGVAACVLLLWGGPVGTLYGVFALSQLAIVGWGICWVNYVLELCHPERSASYVAVVSLLLGPVRVVLPMWVGPWLAERFGYAILFWVAAVMTAASALALATWVPEPRLGVSDALPEEDRASGPRREDHPAEVRAE